MKRVSTYTLAIALAFGATASIPFVSASAQQAAAGAEAVEEFNAGNISEAVRGPVAAAQTALSPEGTFDAATVRGQLEAARGAVQNDDDRFIVGQLMLQLGVKMQQNGADAAQVSQIQGEGLRLALDSDRLQLDQRATYWTFLGNMANSAGNGPEAITAYENALRYNPNNADAQIQVANAQFENNNLEAGYTSADAALRIAGEQGEISPTWISVPLNAAIRARDADRVLRYGTQLVEAEPTPEIWNQVLLAYSSAARFDDQATLDMMRLLRAAGALDANTYPEYASLAIRRGLPGEAKAVIDDAASNGVSVNSEITAEVDSRLGEDRASLDGSRSAAQSETNGGVALNTGDAFASYGQHDAAIELYRLAKEKGGVDAGTADLRIAAAHVAANRTGEARSLLETVTGPREGLAQFWLAYLDSQSGGASAAAPATVDTTVDDAESSDEETAE